MLLCASESTKDSLDISADNLAQMIEDARKSELSEIMREIRIFSSLVEQIRYSASRRILTEMAIIRAARGRMGGADETARRTSSIRSATGFANWNRGFLKMRRKSPRDRQPPTGEQTRPREKAARSREPEHRRRPAHL